MGDFRKLAVWEVGQDFVVGVYRLSRQFPSEERFGLTSQVRRAAISIVANIAEGAGRESDRDFRRFLCIARGSLQEVIAHLLIAERLGYIPQDALEPLLVDSSRVGGLLTGLIRRFS